MTFAFVRNFPDEDTVGFLASGWQGPDTDPYHPFPFWLDRQLFWEKNQIGRGLIDILAVLVLRPLCRGYRQIQGLISVVGDS